jgi:phosphate:Na+ symporter
MMTRTIGELVVGLGFFFVGLGLLGENLKRISSHRFRTLILKNIATRRRAFFFGSLFGAIMQNASAAMVILASLQTAGLVSVRQVLPVISGFSLGMTVLVLLAVIDIHLAVVFLTGITGIALHFSKKDRPRHLWSLLFGLGLIFYSLDIMKGAAASLSQAPWFSALILNSQEAGFLSLVIGVLLGFIAQSSTVVAMLTVGFVAADAFPLEQALPLVYASMIGSNLFRILLSSSFRGSTRQLVRFQNILNLTGAVSFIILYYIEQHFHVPLIIALVKSFSSQADMQVFLAFFLLNITAILILSALQNPIAAWLERSLPSTPEQAFAEPKFLVNLRHDDVPSALYLIWREELRELEQISALAAPLRENATGPSLIGRYEALVALGEQVRMATHSLTQLDLSGECARGFAHLQDFQSGLSRLADACYDTFELLQLALKREAMVDVSNNCLESLEFLLLSVYDALASADRHDIDACMKMCHDRGPIMQQLRHTFLITGKGNDLKDRTLLLDLTISFEKSVWMLRNALQMASLWLGVNQDTIDPST